MTSSNSEHTMTSRGVHQSVISQEELLQHLHPSLLHLDYNDLTVILAVFFSSVLVFINIFILAFFISSISQTFRLMKEKEKWFWSLAIVRGVYGIVAAVVGAWSIFC